MRYKLLVLMLLTQLATWAQQQPLQVANLTITAPPALAATAPDTPTEGRYFYGFNQADAVLLDASPAKGGQTINLEVREYPSGSVVYAARAQKKIRNLQLVVPKRTVYEFILTSATGQPLTAHLSIKRRPTNSESRFFNPNITWQTKQDTTWATATEKVSVKGELVPVTLVDKTFRVASMANLNPSRVAVPFKLPVNTVHWVYWVGVGQEPVEQLKQMTTVASKGAAALASTVSPVAAFGLGMIPNLPQVNASGNIDYYFMAKASADKFIADPDTDWKHFGFAQGSGIVTDYKLVQLSETPKTADGTLYAVFRNSNAVTGLDVTLKVVAFEQERKQVNRQMRKPLKVERRLVPVYGE